MAMQDLSEMMEVDEGPSPSKQQFIFANLKEKYLDEDKNVLKNDCQLGYWRVVTAKGILFIQKHTTIDFQIT